MAATIDSPPARRDRQDSRKRDVLDAAAALFAENGYQGTSMRDIAKGVGMLPGSLYCHFPSKSELLLAVYREGVARIETQVEAAVACQTEPWAKLEALAAAHLEMLLARSAYAKVVVRVVPSDDPAAHDRLVALRERYEAQVRSIVAQLALPAELDRDLLRLFLIGALNWTQVWYRPDGAPPREIARQLVRCLRAGSHQEEASR
ncbi:MAG: TetR/AcrR family transcriptional regulator [Pseudomonadota bacterium]